MTRKRINIVLVLCVTGVLIVAGIRFFGPAGVPTDTLPAGRMPMRRGSILDLGSAVQTLTGGVAWR